MIPALIALVGPILGKVLDKIPDAGQREAARIAFELELQKNELKLIEIVQQSDIAQAKINEIEAASTDKFKSWPRPLALWISVLGLAWNVAPVIVGQFFVWFGYPAPVIVPVPEYIADTLLFGLLGLGSLRTVEKIKKR